MYMCIYVCIYICVSIHIYTYTYKYVCAYIYTHMYTYTPIHVYKRICKLPPGVAYIIYVYMCVYIYIHTHIIICVHIYTLIYTNTYMQKNMQFTAWGCIHLYAINVVMTSSDHDPLSTCASHTWSPWLIHSQSSWLISGQNHLHRPWPPIHLRIPHVKSMTHS